MIGDDEIIGLMEEFKIPYRDPHCPEDWKDWYHYVLYDPKTHVRILYNICFNGKPGSGYIADTLFITTPKGFIDQPIADFSKDVTFGYARNRQWKQGDLETLPLDYRGEEVSFHISSDNVAHVAVTNTEQAMSFHFTGKAKSTPVFVPELMPYGKGFMGWGAVAGYEISGQFWIHNRLITITDDWYCYHDRNFGRFDWGTIGWTWFIANAWEGDNKWAYVLHRNNDPDYTDYGSSMLYLYCNDKLTKVFFGETISIKIDWSEGHETPPILPGSMASVFNDRSIRMPTRITVKAKDEKHNLNVQMDVTTHTELIIPDSNTKKYTFLKELSGNVTVDQSIGRKHNRTTNGFFYAEVVH